jgi:hypothetical protein
MRRIPRPSHATVVAYVALFVALTGGTTAVALSGTDTVQSDDLGPGAQVKAPDVADNAVNGADVVAGSLGLADLNATSRPHRLEFGVPGGTAKTPISTIGHLQVSGSCSAAPLLTIYLKNLSGSTGTQNALIANDLSSATTPVDVYTSGTFVGAGVEVTLDASDAPGDAGLAGGNFDRVEGQLVFQTPGRVTTIDFHADTTNTLGCHFYGTAVTSSLS